MIVGNWRLLVCKPDQKKQGLKVDLHMHSAASDGSISLDELLKEIIEKEIKLFSVTEHDTIENVAKISSFASENNLHYVPGVELSATFESRRMHILGYNVDSENQKLLAFTKSNTVLFRKEEDDGIDVKYPGPGEAIDVILASGGAPILAHAGAPFYDPDYKNLISRMIDMGIRGLECYHPQNNKEVTGYCLDVCRRKKLLITGGSDYHGDCVPSRTLGMLNIELGDIDIAKITGSI
jgi:3',5'-nucleoside bisphosphate phosphatase